MTRVMISCGEASGDLYAGALVAELRRLAPDTVIVGLGGERLRAAGAELVADYRGLAVTGLAEAVRVLPKSWLVLRRLVAAADRRRPQVFVAVDFPDFNFRLAAALRRRGVPVVYYIGPQLWAWRPGRMKTMKRLATRVLVIFPFEEALYRGAGVPVEFVGHPLVDLARATVSRAACLAAHNLDPAAPTVALLPGSRPNEVRAMLPRRAAAAPAIARRVPRAQFLVARAPGLADALFAPLAAPSFAPAPPLAVIENRADDVLAAADVAVTASGTATVQAALHDCPMVIVYRLSPLTYRLGKPFVRVDTYGMVNLIAGRRVAPELIQDAFTPEAVADEVVALLAEPARAAMARAALAEVRAKLGGPGASRRAAEAVLRVARGEPPEAPAGADSGGSTI
jgi:lipid-A-disaccharide synthase